MGPADTLKRSDKTELSALFDSTTGASKSKSTTSDRVARAHGGGGGLDALASAGTAGRYILHSPIVFGLRSREG